MGGVVGVQSSPGLALTENDILSTWWCISVHLVMFVFLIFKQTNSRSRENTKQYFFSSYDRKYVCTSLLLNKLFTVCWSNWCQRAALAETYFTRWWIKYQKHQMEREREKLWSDNTTKAATQANISILTTVTYQSRQQFRTGMNEAQGKSSHAPRFLLLYPPSTPVK